MTINDLKLNEHCAEMRRLADTLPYLMRNGMVAELDQTIGLINSAAHKAGYRLNDLRYQRGPCTETS